MCSPPFLDKIICEEPLRYTKETSFIQLWTSECHGLFSTKLFISFEFAMLALCCKCFLKSEFLKVTVSRSCDRAKNFWLCAKSWDMHTQPENLCIKTTFTFFTLFFKHIKLFFLRKISKLQFDRAKFQNYNFDRAKNLLLECLPEICCKYAFIKTSWGPLYQIVTNW